MSAIIANVAALARTLDDFFAERANHMNAKQRAILITLALIVVGMALFPPFHFNAQGGELNLGYSWLFDPPANPFTSSSDYSGTVDIAMLLTQWFGIAIVGAILYFLARDK